MRTGKLQELFPCIVFLDLEVGGQKGLRRESRKSFAVNAGFLLFGWSASIPSEAGYFAFRFGATLPNYRAGARHVYR